MINSLRCGPIGIIVGESRGPEALDMLQAMNTGHDRIHDYKHANSPRELLPSYRETMVLMANMGLTEPIIPPAGGFRPSSWSFRWHGFAMVPGRYPA